MAVPKRKAEFLGLRNLDVFIEDTAPTSNYFNVLECPEVLTQGKSTFLIGGSNDLKPGIDIKIELIKDGGDTVIYTQPIMGHLEGGLRRVSIEVYDDLEPGIYTLYIVGELNPNTVNVPAEWQGTYNVRWSKKISYNAMGVNTQTILFYKQPGISVSEIQKEYVISPSSSATPVYLTGSGEPAPGFTEPQVPIQTATEGGFSAPTYPDKDFKDKAKLGLIEENKPLVKLSGKKGHIGSKGKQVKTMSPVLDDYLISLSGDSTVSSLYVGEDFTINNPQVDASKFTLQDYHSLPAVYTSSVMKVINNTTFVPKDVFYVNDNRTTPPTLVPAPFEITYPISASYLSLPSQTTSSINFTSFADITVKDMTTFSGDVHKVKIYAKSEGSLGDFELIYDSPIESAQVLYDQQEATNQTNMGYFLDTARVQKYWEAYDEDEGLTSGTVEYDATYINDAMKISGSNMEYGHSVRVQNKTAVNFLGGILYNFKARVYGIKRDKKDINGNVLNNASMAIMTYGNAFDKEETTAAHWGDERLTMPTIPDGVSEYDFGIVEGSFLANNTDTGYLQFKVDSGEWYVTDIELKTATDTAFNPDYVTVTTPVPPLLERPDRMRFLVEFYDVNNNMADSVVFSEPITFQGPNINISGDNNILSGSMVIGSALGSGIEMAGVNSGYIRSIGYSGFTSASEGTGYPGFLIWSGSVLPDSGDSYGGVGIELVANSESYLRYKSVDGGELDIRADSFYVGSDTTQFISGSDGNVEISSSNFHLTPEGDVTMSGTITAEAGEIGDWVIRDGKLSGSNATLDATGAALYMSSKGPDTDDSAAFDILRDEYYIDFTPADQGNTTNYYVKFGPNFAIDSDGVLIASGAVFEGQITASTGQIGGAQIESASLAYPPYWRISSSADTEDSVSFISSSRFKVSAGGHITGSQVLFSGGKIAGWDIDSTTIASVDDRVIIDSSNKRITINNTTFGDSGIQLDYNSGTPRMYVGDGSNEFLKYDGTSLSIQTQDAHISGSSITLKSPDFYLGDSSNYVSGSGGNLAIYSTGNTTLSGSSVTIETPTLFMGTTGSAFISASNSNLEISSSNFFLKSDGSINAGAGDFTIDTSGNVVMAGTITATAGTIGGFTIDSDEIKSGTNIGMSSATKAYTINDTTFGNTGIQLEYNSGTPRFFAGKSTGGYVKFDGTNVEVSSSKFLLGDIGTAFISGSDSNIEISSSAFHLTNTGNVTASNIILGDKADGDYLQFVGGTLTVQGDVTANEIRTPATIAGAPSTTLNASSSISSTGLATFKSASIAGFVVNTEEIKSSNESLRLKSSGHITGSQVLFSGGKIANFIIDGHSLTTTGVEINDSSQTLFISSSAFKVKHDGEVSGSDVLFTGGKIGGWTLTDTTLTGGVVTLNSAGSIEVGGLADATTVATTNSGFFADSSGNVLIKGNVSSNDYIKVANGGSIDIKAQVFDLATSTMLLDSGTNNGKIALGSTPPTAHNSGNGIYFDGDAKFLIGSASGDHLQYDGTNFDVQVGSLELDATNIEISSTNASMSLGEGNILLDGANSKILVGSNSSKQIEIFGNSSKGYIATGKNAVTNYTEGFWIANNNANPELNIGTATNFIRFQHGDIVMKTYDFFMGATGSAYVSGSNGNLEISSSMFFVSSSGQTILGDASNEHIIVDTDGLTIKDGIYVNSEFNSAGVTIGSGSQPHISASLTDIFVKQSDDDYLQIDSDSVDVYQGGTKKAEFGSTVYVGDQSNEHIVVDTNGLTIKDNTTVRGKFIAAGAIIGETSKAHISASTLDVTIKEDDNNYAQVSSSGVSILASGTKVAGFASTTTIGDTSNEHLQLSSDGVLLKDGSTTRALFTPGGATLGDTSKPHLSASTTDLSLIFDSNNKAVLDSNSLDFTVGGSGVATFGANPIITGGSVTIRSSANNNDKVVLTADSFKVYDDNVERASFGATTTVGLTGTSAAYSEISSGTFKVRNDSNTFVSASTDGLYTSGSIHAGEGIIGGWSIDKGKIYSSNLNLHSTGIIETADFVSGLKGWRIDSADNGIAEFENAVIRGTLATAVFEKETVNAVGGQLYVANSTMITASAQTSATAATMSVANVGGFTGSYWGTTTYQSDWSSGVDSWSSGLTHAGNQDSVSDGSTSKNDVYRMVVLEGTVAPHSLRNVTLTPGKQYRVSFTYLIPDAGSTGGANGGVDGFRFAIDDSSDEGLGTWSPGVVGTWTTVSHTFTAGVTSTQFRIYPSDGVAYTYNSGNPAIGDLVYISDFSVTNPGNGEIISAKKITDTGFSTEYMLVQSASRNDPSSEKDFSGQLYVVRGYSGSSETDSGSVGDTASTATTYEDGQVVVSTGRVGTGFIRLNANPSDPYTPYIDIVERTGSAIYDVDLKARLGDLSGLSATKLHGTNPANAGFGLYSQNVFLEGGIVANTGSIAGINMESGKLYAGTGTHDNSNTAFYLDSDGQMSLKDKFVWDGSNLSIEGSITITGGSGFASPESVSGSFATPAGVSGSVDTLSGSAASSIGSLSGASASVATQVVLDSAGLALKDLSGNTLADFGATVTVGQDANDKSRIYIDNDSVDLIVDSGGTDSTYASFASTTTVGVTSGDHVSIESTGVSVKDGSTVRGTFTPGGITLGVTSAPHISASTTDIFVKQSSDDYLKIDSDSVDLYAGGTMYGTFAATTTIGNTGAEHIQLDTSGLTIKDSSTVRGKFVAGGATIGNTSGPHISASTTDIFVKQSSNDYLQIDSDSVDLYAGGTQYGTFAATTNIGNTSAEHIVLDTSGLTIKDNTTVRGRFVTGGATIGATSGPHVSSSTVDLSVIYDANNKAVLDSDSLDFTVGGNQVATFGANPIITGGTVTIRSSANNNDKFVLTADSAKIYDNNNEVASFGATTTIGDTDTEHIEITNSHLKLNDSTTTYITMDSSGVQIGDASTGITLDTDGNATFGGTLTIGGLVSGSEQLAGDISGSLGELSGSAADSIGLLAGSSASMATQVVLDSAGMTLKNAGGTTLAEYGTTISLRGNGSTHDRLDVSNAAISLYTNNEKKVDINDDGLNIGPAASAGSAVAGNVRLGSSGVYVYGAATNDYVFVKSDGVEVVTAGTDVAEFGAITRIGDASNEHISMSSDGMTVKDGTTTRATFGSDITMQGGTITLNGTAGTVGHDRVVIGSADIALYTNNEKKVHINDSGMNIGPAANAGNAVIGNVRLGSTGAYVYGAATNDYVFVKSDGVEVVTAGTNVAEFGAISRIGDASNEHISMSSDGVTVRDGTTTKASFGSDVIIGEVGSSKSNVQITSGAINLRNNTTNKMVLSAAGAISIGNQFSVDSSGNATFGGTLTVGGLISGSAQLAGDISGSLGELSGSAADSIGLLAGSSASMATQVVLDSAGMTLKNASGTTLASYGTTISLRGNGSTDDRLDIDSDGIEIYEGGQLRSIFGQTTVLGSGGAAVTTTSTDDCIRISDGEVNIFQDSSNLAKLSSTGLEVTQSGAGVANFAGTTTIGNTGTEHIEITSTSLKLKDGGTTRVEMDSGGVDIGSNFAVDSSGNVTMAGTVSASAGNIAGWTLGSGIFKSANTTGTIDGSTYTTNGMVLLGTGALASKNFYIDTSGNANFKGDLSGASGYFTGDVVATHINTDSGSIGNWTIDSDAIYTGTKDSSGYTGAAGDITLYSDGSNASIHARSFYVDTSGNAFFQGNVSASAGNIGGWTLGSGLFKSADTTGTTDGTAYTTAGMVIGGSGYIAAKNFLLKADGTALFSGNVSASAGNIGGFTIGSDTFYTDEAGIGKAGQDQAFWAGSNTQNSAEFRVSHAGALVASDATVTGAITADIITANTAGNIAGFAITANQLEATGSTSGEGILMQASTTKTITIGDFDGDRMLLDGNNNRLEFYIANNKRLEMGREIGTYDNRDGLMVDQGQIYVKGRVSNAGSGVDAAQIQGFLSTTETSVANVNFKGARFGGGTGTNEQISAVFKSYIDYQGSDSTRPLVGVIGHASDTRDEQDVDAGSSNAYMIGVKGITNHQHGTNSTIDYPMWGGHFSNAVKIEGLGNPGTQNRSGAHNVRLYMANTDTSLSDGDEIGSIWFTGHDPADGTGTLNTGPAALYDDDYTYGKILVEAEAGTDPNHWASHMRFTVQDDGTEREMITISGEDQRVGINDTTPSYTLDVAGDIRATGEIQVDGNLDVNGNIVGDDATDITNIESIYCDYIRADADGANNYINVANDEISIAAGGAERLSIQDNAVIFNEGGVDINFRVESEDQVNMIKVDAGHNTVGIGASGLRTLHVVCDLASEAGTPGSYNAYGGPLWETSRASSAGISDWIIDNLNTSQYRYSVLGPSAYDDNIYFYFRDDGAESSQWYVVIDGDANNFTGQHTVNIVSGSSLLNVDWKGAPEDQLGISGSNINEFAGKIVYATGDYQRWCKIKEEYVSGSEALEINEALPIVDMTSTGTDKRVFGVISDREDHLRKDPDSGEYENDWQMTSGSEGGSQINAAFSMGRLKPGKIRVNSIGEGSIWICNISGSLENGDYITTCEVPGYGSKQNDDTLHNYTVAKITTDCDFTTGNYKTGSMDHNGTTYKTAWVGCTYHCG